jgi:hypothetical protein
LCRETGSDGNHISVWIKIANAERQANFAEGQHYKKNWRWSFTKSKGCLGHQNTIWACQQATSFQMKVRNDLQVV